MPRLTSKSFDFSPGDRNRRFDLILRGVRHIGCSYEGRVFFNNDDADEGTETSRANGYAGSFFVFGKGDCYGAPGHCDPPTARLPYDDTPPPSSLPLEIHLEVTKALLEISDGAQSTAMTLTVVPIANRTAPDLAVDEDRLMEISGPISIVGYS